MLLTVRKTKQTNRKKRSFYQNSKFYFAFIFHCLFEFSGVQIAALKSFSLAIFKLLQTMAVIFT